MKALPDLRLLASFAAVVEYGSMTAAAEALGYVPSAVSQHISALEKSLSMELLVRRPGSRLVLTSAGRSLAVATDVLFAATAEFRDVAQRIGGSEVADLRIGAYGTAASHLLPETLRALTVTETGPGWHLTELETVAGLPLVRSGEIDVLIAHRYLPEDPPQASDGLVVTPLGREPMILMARRQTSGPISLAECAGGDWVAGTLRDADRRLLRRWASEFDLNPRVRYETSDCHLQLALISSGLAVGLIPATLVAPADPNLSVEAVALPSGVTSPSRDIFAVTRTRYGPPVIDDLIAALTDILMRIRSRA